MKGSEHFRTWTRTLLKAGEAWVAHEGARLSASLSLYSLLSLAPLVILSIAIVSLLFDRQSVQDVVIKEVRGLMGAAGSSAVQTIIQYGKAPQAGGVSSLLGIGALLVGASSVFGELQDALNKIWGVQSRGGLGPMSFIRSRLFSFAMVLALGFLLLVSLLFSSFLTVMNTYFSSHLSVSKTILAALGEILTLAAITGLIAVIFRYVPDIRLPWRDVGTGALVTAILFTIGKWLLGLYLGKAAVGSAYGAAGSLVVVIIWVYYSAMIFYFGAEFTRVHAAHAGHGPPLIQKSS
jgi:membrane protein